jgi:hypothetical protein
MIRMIVKDGWVTAPHPVLEGACVRYPVSIPEQVAVERTARIWPRFVRITADISRRYGLDAAR